MIVRDLVEMLLKLDQDVPIRTTVTETEFLQPFSVPQDRDQFDVMEVDCYPWDEKLVFDVEPDEKKYKKVYVLATST